MILFSFISAQSPRERLLARRAAGVEAYKNILEVSKNYFLKKYPQASPHFFQEKTLIRGAKRVSYEYTAEGCRVQVEIPLEGILELLSNAAESASVPFREEDAQEARIHFGSVLRVSGFGKYGALSSEALPSEEHRIEIEKTPEDSDLLKKKDDFNFEKYAPPEEGEERTRVENFELKKDPLEESLTQPKESFDPYKNRRPLQNTTSPRWSELDYTLDHYLQEEDPPERPWYRTSRSSVPDFSRDSSRYPIRTYEWESYHSSESLEKLDQMIEDAIEDALEKWGYEQKRQRRGWQKIREYQDPETGEAVEEYRREGKIYTR